MNIFRDFINRLLRPPRYYTVVSGDSLSKIAYKYYGDTNKFNLIAEANPDRITDVNKIQPGWHLRIPWE